MYIYIYINGIFESQLFYLDGRMFEINIFIYIYIYICIYIYILWVVPLPSTSHHHVLSIFSRGSLYKPSFATTPGKGDHPMYIQTRIFKVYIMCRHDCKIHYLFSFFWVCDLSTLMWWKRYAVSQPFSPFRWEEEGKRPKCSKMNATGEKGAARLCQFGVA